MAACYEIAAHSAYDMFAKYKYLVNLVFVHLEFWSGYFLLIAPFPDTFTFLQLYDPIWKKVQVGKDQEKAQSEKDSHSKNQGGKKTKLTIGGHSVTLT